MIKTVKMLYLSMLCLCFLSNAAMAAEEGANDGRQIAFPEGYHEAKPGAPPGSAIRKYADDTGEDPQKNFGGQPVHDNELFYTFSADRFEYQAKEGQDGILYDVAGWIGGDYNKLYFESEGVWLVDDEKFEEVEAELLYGRNIAKFWDLQIGIRHDFEPDPERTFAAFGVEGMAPYWFEIDATAYVSEDGDVSAGIEAEYELLLSQRLIVMPRFETGMAVHEVEKYGVGQGINDITLGVRLRYEIRRELAPYVGFSWSRKLGETADLAEAEGEDTDLARVVAGVRFWF